MTPSAILEIKELKTCFETSRGIVRAVDGVTFEIVKGETLALIGESGCGKSVTALSILRLIQEPPGKIIGGEVIYEGRNLLKLNRREIRAVRGKEISMIFQEPMTSLNPLFSVGNQIVEALRLHEKMSRAKAYEKSIEMLKLVDIPDPERRVKSFPHEMSGGMRQRVMIAMALACHPKLLIADEPTTALDVTIQAQILDLIRGLMEKMGMSLLLITHDFGVVAEMADKVGVMYAGKMAEYCNVNEIFLNPRHPYTVGLLNSIPGVENRGSRLNTIPGNVPGLFDLPEGCSFQGRCPLVSDICRKKDPVLKETGKEHMVRCWHSDKVRMEGLFD